MTDDLLILFVAMAALAALLARIGIWSPRRLRVKLLALLVTALFLPVTFSAFASLMSRPKPATMEWVHSHQDEAVVLAARLEEDEAIYLWLAFDDVTEPRAYALPWSDQLARELHESRRMAEDLGMDLRMRLPFKESATDERPRFFAEPQPAPEEKAVVAENPIIVTPKDSQD